MINQFLWIIFPYLCMAVFVIGHIFRYRYDQFGWTAKSSEFIEKKQLMIGSFLFHIGIIPVFLGHVSGLGIPKQWTRAVGISRSEEHTSELQSRGHIVCRLLLEKKNKMIMYV